MDDNILGKRMRHLRERKNLKQKEVAKILNVSDYQMSRMESGKTPPDPDLINKIAEFYEVTTDYLLGRSSDPRLTAKEDEGVNEEVRELLEIIESLPEDRRKEEINKVVAFVKGLKAASTNAEDV